MNDHSMTETGAIRAARHGDDFSRRPEPSVMPPRETLAEVLDRIAGIPDLNDPLVCDLNDRHRLPVAHQYSA